MVWLLNLIFYITISVSRASTSAGQHGALNITNANLWDLPFDGSDLAILKEPDSTFPVTSSAPIRSSNASSHHIAIGTDSANDGIITKCDGDTYGYDLNLSSCYEAWWLLPKTKFLRSVGKREAGYHDIQLPFRVSSSDGLCGIDVVMKAGNTEDVISGNDIAQAAAGIIEGCIERSPNRGGVSGFLGLGKNLAVRIVSYSPQVQCADSPGKRGPPMGSCRGPLDHMPASYDRQKFGRRGNIGVAVGLPQTFAEGSNECAISINTGGSPTSASWYMLYLAAAAIDAICVRREKAGIAVRLGFDGQSLFVTIRDGMRPNLLSGGVAVS